AASGSAQHSRERPSESFKNVEFFRRIPKTSPNGERRQALTLVCVWPLSPGSSEPPVASGRRSAPAWPHGCRDIAGPARESREPREQGGNPQGGLARHRR